MLSPPAAVIAAFISLFVVAIIASAVLGSSREEEIGTIAVAFGGGAILGFGVLLLMRLPRHERRVAMETKRGLRGAVLHGVNLGVGMVITAGALVILGTLIDPSLEERLEDATTELGPGVWGTALTVFALVVLAPLGEELVFRVLLLRALARRMSFWAAALISSVVFACAHLDVWIYMFWPRFIALVVIGMGLAWLYRWRGFWAAVAAHATVNAVASIALIAQG